MAYLSGLRFGAGDGVDENRLKEYLRAQYPTEDNACEWKEFKNLKNAWSSDSGNDVESYISAIANMCGGHLVLGVVDKTLDIVGIREFAGYSPSNARERLAGRVTNLDTENLKIEEFSTSNTNKTVWVIHIPKHLPRRPVYAHGRAWQRLDECLVPMRQERLDAILSEPLSGADWSAAVVETATVANLDETAIEIAREKFKEKHKRERWFDQIDLWDISSFLDKLKLTAQGEVTRAAILLLGKPEAAHFLSPAAPQITWALEGEERAYEHFGPPFILTTTHLLRRIRNPLQKLFPQYQLLAAEIPKYETRTILEGLHNCLAHQDYERCERVVVTEKPDRLIFENAGGFVDGSPEDYFTGRRVPRRYRNNWLTEAMYQVGMIDKRGYGINEMTLSQRQRYLPLPSYSGSSSLHTRLEVLGRPIDVNYTHLLLDRKDLDLDTVILLDRVQKKMPISDKAAARLRKEGLIEGRKPNFHVSAAIAAATETQAAYAKEKGVDKAQLKRAILSHLQRSGAAKRPTLIELVKPMLPSGLTDEQKVSKVKNLLHEMRSNDESIRSEGHGAGAFWRIV